jgi:hypothetical protein
MAPSLMRGWKRRNMKEIKDMPLEEKLRALYRIGEYNIRIQSFYDSGWEFTRGDTLNGFDKPRNFETFAEGVDWLMEELLENVDSILADKLRGYML